MSYGVQSAGIFGSTSQTDGNASISLRPFADLDLTADQRKQIRSILKTAASEGLSQSEIQQEINAILTPSQQTTLQNDLAALSSNGSSSSTTSSTSQSKQSAPPPPGGNPFADPNGPFANLDLTSSQQSQIASILQNGQSKGLSFDQINAQISGVLTTTQQATFATDLQNLPPPPDVQTAQAIVSGQRQSGSGGTSSSSTSSSTTKLSNGLTLTDIQNQVAAATSLILQQFQHELTTSA